MPSPPTEQPRGFTRCCPRPGLTLVELLVCVAIIAILIGLTLAAVQRSRAAAARTVCADRLRQLGLALHNYHQTNGVFPPGVSSGSAQYPYPFLGWEARLLPFLEQEALWQQTEHAFRLDPVFWNVPPHTGFITALPAFLCPADPRAGPAPPVGSDGLRRAVTSYLGVEGTNAGVVDGVLYLDSHCHLTDITDGASNTLLIGERPPNASLSLGWWYGGWGQRKNGDGEMLLGTRSRNYAGEGPGCPEGPYHFTPGRFNDPCAAFHFWSPHPGGAYFAFADGSVHFLSYNADPIMPALGTRAGGEVATLPD
jgi:prepilin-type N-terminal cleavage/methylation domain-containing protein/prepilin-type processing-associated H-X9-DG protein